MDIGTGVSVLLCAVVIAVAARSEYSRRDLLRRLAALESSGAALYAARFAAPDDEVVEYRGDDAPSMDIVGAWAWEQARAGSPVSDEEMAVQRRMWASEGSYS